MIAIILSLLLAHATPLELTHQARLVRPDGTPVEGGITVEVSLWSDGTSDEVEDRLWVDHITTTAERGYISLQLGTNDSGESIQPAWAAAPMWVGLAIDGVAMGRSRIGAVPRAGVTDAVRLVDEAPLPCGDGELIVLRGSAPQLQVCMDGEWAAVSAGTGGIGATRSSAGPSCKAILDGGDSTGSGLYWLDNGSGDPRFAYQAWCDMSIDGGGWTLVVRSVQANTSSDFHYGGTAWTSGLGDAGEPGTNLVSPAWFQLDGPTEVLFLRNDTTDSVQGSVTDCVGSGSLSEASGLCSALDSPSELYTTFGYAGNSHRGLGFNMRSPTTSCNIQARVYLASNIWDGGDSEVVTGLGYNYSVGNQYSSSCSCPYSNYCGTGLWSSSSLYENQKVWMYVR